MTTATRFDFAPIRAKVTEDGYIIDSPVVSRVGIFNYRGADGKIRKELRRPNAVFDPLHLASLRGKPVTVGHPGYVNAKNARQHVVGTILSDGRQDGDCLVTDLIIYDTDAVTKGGKRELSLGYSVTLKEEPGEWNGQHFDAEQVAMIVNHCGIVEKGRAGVARLNLDEADAEEVSPAVAADEPDVALEPVVNPENGGSAQPVETTTTKPEYPPLADPQAQPVAPQTAARGDMQPQTNNVLVRVDGAEVPAPIPVARELDRERERTRTATLRADTAEAERDALLATAEKHKAELAQARRDAAASARARVKLETDAAKHGAEVRSDMNDRELREAVIRRIRGDEARFDGRSDDYVSAAYDIAISEASRSADQSARNRAIVQVPVPGFPAARADGFASPQLVSADAARERMIRNTLAR